MKKIEFVNGTTIDGAKTFNDMQSNIEEVFNGGEPMGSIVVEDIKSKNLFNINTMVEGINSYRNFQDGILVAIAQFNSLKIPVNPNETYSFSTDATAHSNLCFFDSSMNYISGLVFDNQNTLTTPNNCYYITMTVKNDYTWCQLEKGQTATEYTPYKRFDSTPIINDGALKLKEVNIIPITPNVGSNYDAYGNSYYYKVGTKVHVHLGLSGLTPGNSNVIFSIPKGFRPLTIITAVGVGQGLDDITSLQASLYGDITVYSKSQYALFDYEYDAFN